MTGKLKKVLLPNLPYLLFAWLFDKLCQAVRLSPGADASEKLLRIAQGFTEAFASLWLSLHPLDLLLGVAGAALVRLAVYLKAKNAKKYRRGVEYGSARWGRPEDIAPYIDPVPDWNIPLTRTESLTMTSRPKDPKTARNKNILVIGGSGSGKTRFFVKPSLLQMHSSYVVTDPKGQLLRETGKLLAHGGPKRDENGKPVRDKRGKVVYEPYRIKVLNTINFSKSMKYNPLAYVRSEKDITLRIDLENNIKAQQSAGYARWAKLQNLKQAAKTMNFLTEHGIEQYAELESKVMEISAVNDEAAAALKDVERRLGDMAVLIKNLTTYKQFRPVVLGYRKAKDKAAFRREHESQLILYEAAAKAIKDAGITRLPDLAALKAEYRELDKQKARLYEQYGEVKRELKEYGIIKQNVDSILRVTPGKEQAQEL